MDLFILYLKYYIIPTLLISTVLLTLILLFKRIYYEQKKPLRESITNKVEIFLTEMILSKPDKEILKKHLSEFRKKIPLHKSWCKEMVINDMIRFKQNLKGKSAEHVNYFYQVLKLNTYSAGLIRDFRNYNKCEGFYHYQALDYKEGMPLIKPYLKHSNIIIQSNANMAYISLSKNIMESFKEFPAKISFLNSIKIMDIFHEKKVPMPKNIDEWIATNNNSVTRLGLKTMVYYNYRNRSKEIIALLQKEDDVLKKEVLITVRELFLTEAKEDLISLFETSSVEIKSEILESLRVIGDESIIPFLKYQIQLETNKDIKLKAVDCLNQFNKTALDELANIDPDTAKMVKHVREIYL